MSGVEREGRSDLTGFSILTTMTRWTGINFTDALYSSTTPFAFNLAMLRPCRFEAARLLITERRP